MFMIIINWSQDRPLNNFPNVLNGSVLMSNMTNYINYILENA